ncbi:flagellar biosynthesis anti-sigma factor FlgM [Thiomicrospira pelophila]|uniref:flagellar biosynthesis anti-sigma factor FlgM n=1 Tax=Thiomicrospira pelophila TaxID=934 RepID=UPI0004A7238F|nr:flagellar biosynthesis anti-sigma factor FlgM [Thiomicrospira pelophila]
MDIKNIQNNLANSRANETYKTQEKATPGQGSTAENTEKPQTDRVTLTSMSAQLRELEKRAAAANVSNESRIAELKQAISDGTYKVDAAKIADKLIKTEMLFAKA